MDRPPTKYARAADGTHLAYQTFGEGPVSTLHFGEQPTSCDCYWEHPAQLRFWRFVGSFTRMVVFDGRGIGSSDPCDPIQLGDCDIWAEDARTVLDTCGVEETFVSGEGYGGHIAIAFAMLYPERTRALTLFNSYARLAWAPDYEWGIPPEQADSLIELIRSNWGTGNVVRMISPRLEFSGFEEFASRYERQSASPGIAAAFIQRVASSDVRDRLPSIEKPALVGHTGDLTHIGVEHSRYLAEMLPNAKLVESPTKSLYVLDPGSRSVLKEFITGIADELGAERQLLALLFTDIVASTSTSADEGDARWRELLDSLDAYVRSEAERIGGRYVKQLGDGHLVVFSRPTEAIRAATRVRSAAQAHGIQMRAGIHFGEVEVREDGDVTGSAANIAAHVMGAAGGDEILVSRTTADLAAGSGFEFKDRGTFKLKGVAGGWQLFEVDTSSGT